MFKELDVVMIPTNKKSKIYLNQYANTENGANKLVLGESIKGEASSTITEMGLRGYLPQELVVTSNEKIEEGDYCYHSGRKIITQWFNKPGSHKEKDALLKIIATTDSSLEVIVAEGPYATISKSLPQEFIQSYVKKYNKGIIITKVMVEYEEIGPGFPADIWFIKTNPDNIINIKCAKDTWTKDEHISNIEKYRLDYEQFKRDCHFGPNEKEIKEWTCKWIEENLNI